LEPKPAKNFDVSTSPARHGTSPLAMSAVRRFIRQPMRAAISADGKTLACFGRDGYLRVWDVTAERNAPDHHREHEHASPASPCLRTEKPSRSQYGQAFAFSTSAREADRQMGDRKTTSEPVLSLPPGFATDPKFLFRPGWNSGRGKRAHDYGLDTTTGKVPIASTKCQQQRLDGNRFRPRFAGLQERCPPAGSDVVSTI